MRLESHDRSSTRRALTLATALLLIIGVGIASPALGADRRKKDTSRKNFIPTQLIGKKLLKVAELAEEEKFQEALEVIEPLTRKRRLKEYDEAKVWETYGYMLAANERFAPAAEAFEKALAVDYLPDANTESLKYNLAQLYMALENFGRAIELLEDWFVKAENPGAQPHFLLTAAYAQKEEWAKALPHARLAVEKSDNPSEQYYQLLLAMEFQNGNLVETLDVLKILVTQFPRKTYYMQLAYGYSNMGEEEKAMAVLQLAHTQGFMNKESEYTNLAQRYLFHQLPWPAARLMREGLEKGHVEETPKNLELLANALLHAREYSAAIEPLRRAAELSEDGDLYVRLAQVHLEVENWKGARAALEKAVAKGDLRDPAHAQLLLGISNFNEKRYVSARKAFQMALKDENTEQSARKWLEHVDRAESKRGDTAEG